MMRTEAGKLASLPKRKADFIEPMDCAPVPKLADGPGWLYEIKLDGYRAVAVKSGRGASLFLRSQRARCQLPYTEPGDQCRSSSFRLKTYTSLTSAFAKDRLETEGVGANALAWQQLSMAHIRCCNAHYLASAEGVG